MPAACPVLEPVLGQAGCTATATILLCPLVRVSFLMKTYIIKNTLMLSFFWDGEQLDVLLTDGTLESDGHTVWLINENGRFESITTANIIDVAIEQGLIAEYLGP